MFSLKEDVEDLERTFNELRQEWFRLDKTLPAGEPYIMQSYGLSRNPDHDWVTRARIEKRMEAIRDEMDKTFDGMCAGKSD